MKNDKKPSDPVEEGRRAQEIQLTQLGEHFCCEIDGTTIQNIKSYSYIQASNGNVLLNLTLEFNAAAVSATIQAQMQPHL